MKNIIVLNFFNFSVVKSPVKFALYELRVRARKRDIKKYFAPFMVRGYLQRENRLSGNIGEQPVFALEN